MKKIFVLNEQSLKNTINSLELIKNKIQGEIFNDFYKRCYNFFVRQANYYLLSSGIGDLVIAEIQNSWSYKKLKKRFRIYNTAEKAVYVEFGVGVVGEENEHPNAENAKYKYNEPSDSKFIDGAWMFKAYEDELDIPQKAIVSSMPKADGRLKILTYGTEGCFYAFNALDDLKLEIPKIWEEIKIKYWG
jgi:hypothetical protein